MPAAAIASPFCRGSFTDPSPLTYYSRYIISASHRAGSVAVWNIGAESMDLKKLRAWWFHKQALDGRLQGQGPAQILAATGWARSVGGSAPYLTLFARGKISREAVDSAVAALEIHELPSARGCTYVLPAPDFALALAAAQPFEGEMKVAYKLGVTDKEIAKLRDAVVRALEKEALDPDQIREA